MTAGFALHPRLEADSIALGRLALCQLRLMDDQRFPWLLLIPERANLAELHELSAAERAVLIEEIAQTGAALQQSTGAEKLNVGALGNVVRQLHIHIVARSAGDSAWPGPVWGVGRAMAYTPAARQALTIKLIDALKQAGIALNPT